MYVLLVKLLNLSPRQVKERFLMVVITIPQAADAEEPKSGFIRSEGDMLLNGALPCLLADYRETNLFHPSKFYPMWTVETASHSLKEVLQLCTGWQSIHRPVENVVPNQNVFLEHTFQFFLLLRYFIQGILGQVFISGSFASDP